MRVIKWYHTVNGFYPSVYICNQLPVIKPSASAAMSNMIGYFCEIHLWIFCLVKVAKYHAQDDGTKQLTHLPGMILPVVQPVENVSFSNQNNAEKQQLKRHILLKARRKPLYLFSV